MKPDFEAPGVSLYLGDNREILPLLSGVDAVLTDPPYGLKEAAGRNKTRGVLAKAKDYGFADWDNKPCSHRQIKLMRKLSRYQIIFGGNYFFLPPSSCWLVWDKKNGANDFADCELAWTNLRKAVRRIYWQWNGMIRKGREERFHPTQKPVGVMEWCLRLLPDDCNTILDPFMGSGSTGVACVRLGRQFVGIEKDPGYFDVAVKRISEEMKRPKQISMCKLVGGALLTAVVADAPATRL